MPPSAVRVPPSPPPVLAVTMVRPSIIAIFARSGSKGALHTGSVKSVVVAVCAAGRHSGHWTPSGFWITRKRRGAAAPFARASMSRSNGSSSAADPPHARKNDRRAIRYEVKCTLP